MHRNSGRLLGLLFACWLLCGATAAAAELTTLWDKTLPFPTRQQLTYPADAVDVVVHRAGADGYDFLHDAAIVQHKGFLLAAWYNCPRGEMVGESMIRGRRSRDGGRTWSGLEVIAADVKKQGVLYVPVAFLSHGGRLYAFVTNMRGGPDRVERCEVFVLDEQTDRWVSRGFIAGPFLPNCAPQRLRDGYFLMAGRMAERPGELPTIPAVAISRGEQLTEPWHVVRLLPSGRLPDGRLLPIPETTAIVDGAEVLAVVRREKANTLLFRSRDLGRSWSAPEEHNFPMAWSKVYAGRLSTGQRYVLCNVPCQASRDLLVIAVSRPGAATFCRMWKLRDGHSAALGCGPEWSYPVAIEHNGQLFVVYTSEKHHCVMTRVPVKSLAVSDAPAQGSPRGELLYNGIRLPEVWPPRNVDPRDTAPMHVPYLESRPAVVPIDVGRQLFVDDFLVERTDMHRVYHRPEKFAGNPILRPETPLERDPGNNPAAAAKGGLWWDPATQRFQMWYDAGWIQTICYATSRDGLHWERPSLDIRPGTNQAFPRDLLPDTWSVVLDPAAKDPQQRYKITVRMPGGGYTKGVSMTSPDGIHWSNRVATGPAGDCSTMFYNPFRKKWVYSLRSSFRGRSRDYWECDDFLAGARWQLGNPVLWVGADRLDPPDPVIQRRPQLYNLNAVAYESILLGAFDIHRGPENEVCNRLGLPKITETNFAYSRDGFHWYRPDRRAHIPAERRDVWDRGYIRSLSNLCCVRGDRLWFYYTAVQGDTTKTNCPEKRNGMYSRGATGVAFLRRDGFASMEAGPSVATLTTRPLTFRGRRVFVNAATQAGELRVEILDPAGQVIAPYSAAHCRPIAADTTLSEVTWEGANDVAALAGRPVRFRFTLRQGALFAFWVSRDGSGRSDGYVAGGGPGFTGPCDTVGRAALEAERKLGLASGR